MNPLRADLISPLDMFKIGVGPSSSHTVGPMIAALEFRRLASEKLASLTETKTSTDSPFKMTVELFGSLSLTGKGHQTDGAICAGLDGLNPRTSPIEDIWSTQTRLDAAPSLDFAGVPVHFCPKDDIFWHQ